MFHFSVGVNLENRAEITANSSSVGKYSADFMSDRYTETK